MRESYLASRPSGSQRWSHGDRPVRPFKGKKFSDRHLRRSRGHRKSRMVARAIPRSMADWHTRLPRIRMQVERCDTPDAAIIASYAGTSTSARCANDNLSGRYAASAARVSSSVRGSAIGPAIAKTVSHAPRSRARDLARQCPRRPSHRATSGGLHQLIQPCRDTRVRETGPVSERISSERLDRGVGSVGTLRRGAARGVRLCLIVRRSIRQQAARRVRNGLVPSCSASPLRGICGRRGRYASINRDHHETWSAARTGPR